MQPTINSQPYFMMKIFFYIMIVILFFSCHKKDELMPGDGEVSNNDNSSVNTKPPVANAGADQTITILSSSISIVLNGNSSYDSSGMRLQFFWRQISGPANSSIPNPGQKECYVDNINTPGIYSFELKVWNSSGSDLDTTDITISTPSYCQVNRPEVPVSLTFLSDLPGQIQNPEIVAAGNKLVIPAWFSNTTGIISNNIYVYDLVVQNWTTIHASQTGLGVATIAAGNKVFFAGGLNEDMYTTTSVVDIYDLATNTWTATSLSEPRGYCKAVVSGNKIFFAGGLKNYNTLSDKVDIYDLGTNSWSSAILPGGAREVGAAVAIQNKVFFCGGYASYDDPTGFGGIFTTPSTSIDIYDTDTHQWSAGAMQVNKGSFAAISVNEKIYLAGGVVNNAVTFHLEELNVNTMNSSSSCLYQPMISYDSKSAVIKNNMIVFFAYSPFYGIERNKFDIYNIQTGIWSVGILPLDLVPDAVYSAIVSMNNEIYTVIGTKLYRMNL